MCLATRRTSRAADAVAQHSLGPEVRLGTRAKPLAALARAFSATLHSPENQASGAHCKARCKAGCTSRTGKQPQKSSKFEPSASASTSPSQPRPRSSEARRAELLAKQTSAYLSLSDLLHSLTILQTRGGNDCIHRKGMASQIVKAFWDKHAHAKKNLLQEYPGELSRKTCGSTKGSAVAPLFCIGEGQFPPKRGPKACDRRDHWLVIFGWDNVSTVQRTGLRGCDFGIVDLC